VKEEPAAGRTSERKVGFCVCDHRVVSYMSSSIGHSDTTLASRAHIGAPLALPTRHNTQQSQHTNSTPCITRTDGPAFGRQPARTYG